MIQWYDHNESDGFCRKLETLDYIGNQSSEVQNNKHQV